MQFSCGRLPTVLLITTFLSFIYAVKAAANNDISGHVFASRQAPSLWPSRGYKTENFTIPEIAIKGNGEPLSPGYILMTPNGPGIANSSTAPMMVDNTGSLIWRPVKSFTSLNFDVQKLNKSTVLTYWNGTQNQLFGHGYGRVKILNHAYEVLYDICMPDLNIVMPENTTYPCHLDMHESNITPRGTLLSTVYNYTRADLSSVGGPKDGYIVSSDFLEIDIETQEILFHWSPADHLDQLPFTLSKLPLVANGHNLGTTLQLAWDFFHTNAVSQPFADGSYLLSSRHYWSAIKIFPNGTIDWRLSAANGGDFTLDPSIYFSWQHELRATLVTPKALTLSMFNNDNSVPPFNGTNSSTGLSLAVDLVKRHVSPIELRIDPTEPIFSDTQGSFQPALPALGSNNRSITSHSFQGFGQIAVFREYDETGKNIFEGRFGADNDVAGYRSFRREWVGVPAAKPKVVALPASGGAEVYMSWNGATKDVFDEWIVRAGNQTGELSQVGHVQRAAFETSIVVDGGFKFLQAEAVSHGVGIANSTVITYQG